jgi:quercetin dioxygenase-like cupin family protein
MTAKSRHRVKGTKLLAILGTMGAASLGVVVARRLRSRARSVPEARSTPEATGTSSSLIGHEFNFMGHTFHILESARDTEDGSLRLDYSAPPDANVSEHVHRFQEERFEVLSGKLGVRVGGQEMILGPGQRGVGPPGVPHAWWNPSDR